ncbi:hypothetical protein [Streptomyces sp. SID13726]|uniref:hypothetical protein n=1 Tax=Streptomyces sp. SID13726 TaxID=2706058 RepID=UPI0013B885A7|nr:hypothetical protein [Streptomyces sp. SID13726]NEB01420.1 hypothetical protein [Streptomyces sp. SID13726]
MWADQAAEAVRDRGTACQVLLSGEDILALNLELDALRSRVLNRYRGIDAPIHMIMSTSSAGDGDAGPAPRRSPGSSGAGEAGPPGRVSEGISGSVFT